MPNCTPSLIASQSRDPRRRTATPVVSLIRARPNMGHTWTPNCPIYFLPIPLRTWCQPSPAAGRRRPTLRFVSIRLPTSRWQSSRPRSTPDSSKLFFHLGIEQTVIGLVLLWRIKTEYVRRQGKFQIIRLCCYHSATLLIPSAFLIRVLN